MKDNKNWYIIYTKPKLERKVAELLEKKLFPTYLPEYNKLQYLFGRKRVIKMPVMPLLLFVFSSEQELHKITSTDGVSGLFYKFQKPATIRSQEIAAMQRFLVNHTDIVIDKVPLGCNAETDGKNAEQRNNIFIEDGNETEKLFLPSIGFCLIAKVEKAFLNKVA